MPSDFILNKEVMPTVNKISNAEILLSLPMGWESELLALMKTTTSLDD